MSRYIDADLLIDELKDLREFWGFTFTADGVDEAIDKVEEAPTADVVEVRHGEWKDRYENKYANHYYECSICGEKALDGAKVNDLGNIDRIQVLSDFCPHCGAYMKRSENAKSDR